MTDDAPKTVDDLAALTGLSKPTVQRAIRDGQLPGYYVQLSDSPRGRFVIPARAFDAYAEGRWTPIPRDPAPEPSPRDQRPTDGPPRRLLHRLADSA